MIGMHLSAWSEDKLDGLCSQPSKLQAPTENKNQLHWPGIEPGADRSTYSGNDPGYHYPTSALEGS